MKRALIAAVTLLVLLGGAFLAFKDQIAMALFRNAIAGQVSGDLLAEFVLAMRHGLGLNKILATIHTYPTLAEANKYAAGAWKRAHAPQRLLAWLERYHAWRRRQRS